MRAHRIQAHFSHLIARLAPREALVQFTAHSAKTENEDFAHCSLLQGFNLIVTDSCHRSSPATAAGAERPPFHVFRSRMGNLPIYTDWRGGGRTRMVTILRKYSGDVNALKREVERVCEARADLFHGRMEVKGNHREKLGKWLSNLGF